MRHGEDDEEAEDEDGGGDALLDEGNVDAGEGEARACDHHGHEGGGDLPEGALAELRCPEPDGEHGGDVVDSGKGVEDAVGEAGGGVAGVSGDDGGEEEEGGGGGKDEFFHTGLLKKGLWDL